MCKDRCSSSVYNITVCVKIYISTLQHCRSVGRYGPVMTDSSRLQQHHTTSDDPGQGCKAHEGGIRP